MKRSCRRCGEPGHYSVACGRGCLMTGCIRPHRAKGLCDTHYQAARRRLRGRPKQRYDGAWYRAWYARTADAQRAKRARHRAQRAEYNRRWSARNPERRRAMEQRQRDRNPEASRERSRRHDALRRGAAGAHTQQEWLEKCALLGNVCLYCGEAKPLTRDHKVPLSRGGTDDIDNVVPACHSCNCAKRSHTPEEFFVRPRGAR